MNKVMNINIGGTVFFVDEIAYEKLNSYLKAIAKRFKNAKGGDEIIADIESRIVELLQQKLNSNKQIVTIDDIDEVITIMGNPSDFDSEDDFVDADVRQIVRKRLFRDVDNRMVGGVCSGLSAYFQLDALWFRLGFVIATISGLSILAYLILWIIVPPALSITEKLEMNGNPVNISNIEKSFREEMDGIRSKLDDLASQARSKFKKKR